MSATYDEQTALAGLASNMNQIVRAAELRAADRLEEFEPYAGGDSLERETCSIAREAIISSTLTDAERAEHSRLVEQFNSLVRSIRERDAKAADARRAERQREQLRAQMCPDCFTIHAGDCR